ncbi:MAG: 1-(5-phosphoribosyl)-5-[(5-phosphoribosylamino)methylideneamino] imidazole-4-carboxamide isomerase [Chloroflexi bacterium]|nr:1-(5-phosphoribosyl)-5-[(5-phosphoribosylamino)methylideneamino] imidazole-4-carboxamide isomerase [Chloroflexota bacterium]
MQIIPAIDLQGGRCVRLLRGDFARETVYGDDPVAMARHWRRAGADLLHAVDLDGARQGRPAQPDLIRRMSEAAPLQVGGGLRTPEDVDAVLQVARRAVLGTAALDRDLIGRLARDHGERLVVALDTRHGRVTVQGWTEASDRSLPELARELLEAGVRRFLHTDVERDGTLTSPNFRSLEGLIALGAPVIASGGVSSVEDIRRLRALGAEAAVVGRALYEGTLDLREAMDVAG